MTLRAQDVNKSVELILGAQSPDNTVEIVRSVWNNQSNSQNAYDADKCPITGYYLVNSTIKDRFIA